MTCGTTWLWGLQGKCRRQGWGWQESDLAHSVGSMLLAPGRVLLGMASEYRLQLLPVGRQTAGCTGIGIPEGRASRPETSPQAGTHWRSERLNRLRGFELPVV